MADLSDSVNWFEIDNSNNKPSPNGWPEGMMPSGVNDSARADKGALKRFWDRINPVEQITPAGGVWTFTTDNPSYPAAYINGEVYCFLPVADSAGGDQFQVNSLAAKPIWKRIYTGTGWLPVAAHDIMGRRSATLVYDSTLNGGAGAFVLVNPFVPVTSDGAGGITVAGNITAGGSLYSANDLFLGGGTIYFAGNPSSARGPYIVGDNTNFSFTLGPTTPGAFYFNSNPSTNVATIDGTGSFHGRDAILSGTLTAGFIHSVGSIEASGTITADGAYINAAAYFLSGSVFANTGGIGERLIYDGGGGAALNLQANDSFYDNNYHHFRNSALGATFSLDSAGNGGFAGSVTGGYIHSTGDVHADNALTGASVSVTGHIQTGDIYSVTGYGTTDTTGAANFKIYSSGGYGFVQFLPSWFLQFNGTNGLLAWFIDLSGPTAFWLMRASDRLCFNSLGPVAGAGAYINTSDRRGKKNIVPSHRGLAEILELTPVEFDRISAVDAPRELGFTAQDVIGVLPEAVRVVGMTLPDGTGGLEDTEPSLGITDATIVAALVNAVKELHGRLAQLETK